MRASGARGRGGASGYALPMRIHTTFGARENATDGDLDRELRDLQRYLDPADPGFMRIERAGEGAELELRTLHLRVYRGGRAYQGTLPPGLTAFVRSFARGAADWDAGIEWKDVTPIPLRERIVPYLVVIAIGIAMLAGIFWYFTSRPFGS